ncbi:S-adenosyl-L-methionine-dependent methyltransferase [Lasiosphaeria ovina]|uniref:S-adenosyl-L-methionine-dependent methyltransferase n=1 Tax=Lasiosphaeria ovina TaxID=92902 RepID=A0AAE0JX67_9PEZI|nr:S-adenosyl-L-methionine-dependent methyltransferase [Lasiosphaeria ovina]
MPRLRPALFWRARRTVSPLATLILPACRDLASAANELRWMREHIAATPSPMPSKMRLWFMCDQRAKGKPLQYVLGSQPFGHVDIKCRPGVLIPRPETEAYTTELARLLLSTLPPQPSSDSPQPTSLNILDLCSGAGCIALELYAQLQPAAQSGGHALSVLGIDVSRHAVQLARENVAHNARLNLIPGTTTATSPNNNADIRFEQADIFAPDFEERLVSNNQSQTQKSWDVLVSNPPYISSRGFARDTARSVRNHEPRLALTPLQSHKTTTAAATTTTESQQQTIFSSRLEDVFYARILALCQRLRPKRVLLEVGSMQQAARVVDMVAGGGPGLAELYPLQRAEVWRDDPRHDRPDDCRQESVGGREIRVRGFGEGRSVYLCRADV